MKLTQGADYGMAAVIYLSQRSEDRHYSLNEISRATEIPEEFLRKIFQTLVKAGIINSFKGRGGGVSLARSPQDITVAQVINPLGEEMGLVRCLREKEICPRSSECPASNFWQKIQKDFLEILNRTTIEELSVPGSIWKKPKSRTSPLP